METSKVAMKYQKGEVKIDVHLVVFFLKARDIVIKHKKNYKSFIGEEKFTDTPISEYR